MTYIKFEPGMKYAKPGAETSDNLDTFADAGYLLTNDDLIVDIDCLPIPTIEKLIQIFGIKTETVWTDRGAHLYFQKSETYNKRAQKVCCLGFKIELKNCNNTKNGITVKRNGVARTVENKGVRQPFPKIFSITKNFDELVGLDDGGGRNNALIKTRAFLKQEKEWNKVLRFINDFIFATPLDEKEFQTICRDSIDFTDKDIKSGSVAEYFVNNYDTVLYQGDIWYKYKGSYSKDEHKLENLIIDKVTMNVGPKFIDDTIKMIGKRSPCVDNKVFDIKFRNGILRNGRFIEIDSEEFTPYIIDVNYIEKAKPVQIVDDYLDNLTGADKQYRNYLMEVLGHCLIVDAELKRALAKFFIFRGDGGNGKGTLLQILEKILNSSNVANLSITDMGESYTLANLIGKLANLGDDIEGNAINNKQMRILKNISTCDTFKVREIYKKPVDVTLTCTMIFTSNTDIRSWEKSKAYERRVQWLPMFSVIKKKDPKIITKLTSKEALEYWISMIVAGYQRLYENAQFSECEAVAKYTEQYHENNNLVIPFVKDVGVESLEGKKISEITQMIYQWMDDAGEDRKEISSKLIKETLWNNFSLGFATKKVGGVTSRILMDQEGTKQNLKP